MKKGFRGTGTVERVDFPNKGIAVTDDGDRVIVKNTIPGQKVEFVVNKVKHQRAEGRLMEVLEKSPLETEEPCPHFGMCGGCTYQTVPYEKQLDMKLTQVKKLISDAIGTEEESGYVEVLKRANTEIRWNFPSVMSTRMAHSRLACTKEEAFMTL